MIKKETRNTKNTLEEKTGEVIKQNIKSNI